MKSSRGCVLPVYRLSTKPSTSCEKEKKWKNYSEFGCNYFCILLVQACSFNKLEGDTALKVAFQGVMRVYGTSTKCNRWYFKFNGNECSGPMTIEAVVYNNWPSGSPNLLHHRSFEGYCENVPPGATNVELWVGSCSGYTPGDAETGWQSVSRIMIEEVPRSQWSSSQTRSRQLPPHGAGPEHVTLRRISILFLISSQKNCRDFRWNQYFGVCT